MADFVTIAEVTDLSVARVLMTALKAHGFHPLEGGEAGLPGMPGIRGVCGVIGIAVPAREADDARMLAEALISDMSG